VTQCLTAGLNSLSLRSQPLLCVFCAIRNPLTWFREVPAVNGLQEGGWRWSSGKSGAAAYTDLHLKKLYSPRPASVKDFKEKF